MPRRYADYLPSDGFTTLNTVSTIGSFVLGGSLLPFVWNVFKSYRYGQVDHGRRPVGLRQLARVGHQLSAAAAQLHRLPRIRSERPAFELHYPHMVELMRAETYAGRRPKSVTVTAGTVSETPAKRAGDE